MCNKKDFYFLNRPNTTHFVLFLLLLSFHYMLEWRTCNKNYMQFLHLLLYGEKKQKKISIKDESTILISFTILFILLLLYIKRHVIKYNGILLCYFSPGHRYNTYQDSTFFTMFVSKLFVLQIFFMF